MKWIAVKRSYHGADEVHRPWIVLQEGQTRGICECWEESSALAIADALNRGQKSEDGSDASKEVPGIGNTTSTN